MLARNYLKHFVHSFAEQQSNSNVDCLFLQRQMQCELP